MDEQQLSEYLKFVTSLLTCEAGTEKAVYQQYSQLVDETLPKLMVAVAEQLEQADEPEDMSWLRREAEIVTEKIDKWNTLNRQVMELYQQWELSTAIPIGEQALELAEEIFPSPNSNLAASLNNLAGLYKAQGFYDRAEPLYLRALKISETSLGLDHPSVATTLNNLAGLYKAQGFYDRAEPLYLRCLDIRSALFGKTGHPDLVGTLTNLALTYARQQKIAQALPLFQQAIKSENQWLTNVITINDAEQRIKDLEQRQPQLELLLSLTQQYFPNDPQVAIETFNAVLSRKAQAVTAETTFIQALRNHPELAPEIQQFKTCQQEIASLSYAIGDRPALKDRLSELLKQLRNLQKNLARSIPAIDLAQQVIDRQALTELLPDGAFLVEFVRYRPIDFIEQKWQPARYLAFIVERDGAGVTALDCGLAEPLDTAIDKFRRAHADIDFSGQNSGMFDGLRNQSPDATIPQPDLLDLLLPHLPTTGTCYLAPDSHLHILPFHLLETPDGKYLVDRYHLHHLTTARDLYRQKFPTSSNPPLILANPDYDGGTIPTSDVNPKTGTQFSHDVSGEPFDRLPINQILGDSIADRYQVPCYSDIEATVDRLEKLNAPRLLVIATHGFSLPAQQEFIAALSKCPLEEEAKILLDRRNEITPEFRDYWQQQADAGNEWSQQLLIKIDNIGIRPKSTDLLATSTNDPMLRSGIALAGANIWRFQGTQSEQFGKGVAFAHDIAQWDLWGNELALIVTCVSGLGEIKNSEGVFGLRRALSIAGAKYVITSLWNIPTKASVLLMDKFFELYESKARPTPPEALAAAQRYVRNITLGELNESKVGMEVVKELQSDRVRGLRSDATNDCQPLTDPHFWGAWICQG